MNLKNKFCRSVDLATFTPPQTKIPGSAPGVRYLIGLGNTPKVMFHDSFFGNSLLAKLLSPQFA